MENSSVEVFVDLPEESSAKSFTLHNDMTLRDFFSRYKMAKDKERSEEWKYPFGTLEAIRRSDGQRVVVRFVQRHRCGDASILLPEFPYDTLCEETAVVIRLQKLPASEHIPRLHECYIMEQDEILVMEHIPAPFITVGCFIKRRGSFLNERVARIIMRQIFVALSDCWERGVYLPIDLEGIAINPKTLQIKITGFSLARVTTRIKMTGSDEAVTLAWLKECAELLHSETYFKVMDALVKDTYPPLWKTRRLSKGCCNLLQRLNMFRGKHLLKTLQIMSIDPSFM